MIKKAVFPGKYIQGIHVLDQLPALINLLGKRALVLASPTVIKTVIPASGFNFEAAELPVERFRGECCEKEISRVVACIEQCQADVLVGFGGGKTIDTAKIAADRVKIPVIIIPSIASSDAPCSGCAVLYSETGIFESVLYQRMNPAAVLVDEKIIAAAPSRFLVAGMGDALATWFEARSCDRTRSKNECGGLGTQVGIGISRLCYDTLLSHGAAAKLACDRHLVTPALARIIEANILLSGIGFESAGLAAAHAIHNGLTALQETHAYYHGEKVALGVLAGLHLTDAIPDEMATVYEFCEAVGLPTTLSEIGLVEIPREHLMLVAEKACAADQPIHHEAGTITPNLVLDAILAADALGHQRKMHCSEAGQMHKAAFSFIRGVR